MYAHFIKDCNWRPEDQASTKGCVFSERDTITYVSTPIYLFASNYYSDFSRSLIMYLVILVLNYIFLYFLMKIIKRKLEIECDCFLFGETVI